MKPTIPRSVVYSVVLLLVLLAVNAGVSWYYTRMLHDDVGIANSYEILDALSDSLLLVHEAETGQRSYILTGDPAFLEHYQSAFSSRAEVFGRLKRLTADRPQQQTRLAQLEEKIAARMQFAERAIALRREHGFEAARERVADRAGKQLTDSIRALVADMERAENAMLQGRVAQANRSYSAASLAEVGMLLLVLTTAGGAYVVIRREILSRFQAESYAHEQREWCMTTLTSIGDAVIVTDTRGMVTLVNSVAGRLTGWGEEAVGKPLSDVFRIVNESTRRTVENPVDKVLREGTIVGLANHTVLIAKNGIDLPIDDSGAPVRNKEGELTGVVLVFRDITERRAAEAALARSARQFHLIAETIPQMVWMAAPGGGIEYLNQRWLKYIGLSAEETEGWEWQRIVHPDDLPRALAKWTHALETGEPFAVEHRLRRADGTYLWHLGQALPLREDGRIIKWFGTCTDFDEQKRTLDALHESDERLKFALSAARMMAWEWDVTTGTAIRSDNAIEILGVPGSGIQAFADLIHPDDRAWVEAMAAQALRGEAPYDAEFRIITPDGRLLWIADKARLRRDPAGRPTHLTGISVDITERKRSEQLLLEADRRKNEFLAMLAHELRNPLAPIRSAAHVLRLLGPEDEKLKWARDVIERQVLHMTRLIDDLLDISRISRGRIKLEKVPVSIASVVAGAREAVRPLTEARNQSVDIVMPAEPGSVLGDEIRLVQVLSNLLNNAVKFTPEGGRITLTVSTLAQEVFITVRDTGIGIPTDMLEHVFDLFTQLDSSLERSQGGLGIGLTLVKNLVEMQGGTVWARSEGRGKGSEFTVRLPLLPVTPQVGPAPPGDGDQPAPASRRLRILVIDDNRDAAQSLCMLLDLLGHETRAAHDGPSGLEITKEFRPQAVFIDIGMPGMSGYDVCARLRKLIHTQDVVCVALTGFGAEEDRERSRDAGFDHHLVKPLELAALRDMLLQIPQ